MSPARAATELRLLSSDYGMGDSRTLKDILDWLDALNDLLNAPPPASRCVCGFCDGEDCNQ